MGDKYYLQSPDGLVIDIKQPVQSGAPLQALDKKTAANQQWTTEDVPGKPEYFWIVSADKDLVIDIKNTGGVKSGSKLQVLVRKNEDNQYWTTVDVPDMPGYFWLESADQSLVIDIDSLDGVKAGSVLQALVKKSENNQYWKWVATTLLPAPAGGNTNYLLADSKGAALTGTTVKIFVLEDIVPDSTESYSFQINCNSPTQRSGAEPFVWQQFGFRIAANELFFWVNCFRQQDLPGGSSLLNWDSRPPRMPDNTGVVPLANNRLPKGWQLTTTLVTDHSSNVTGFAFSIAQPDGTVLNSPTLKLQSLNTSIVSDNLAPILNCQAILVGENGGHTTDFSEGQGIFLCYATNDLTASVSQDESAEGSNVSYSSLPASYPNGEFYQRFGTDVTRPGSSLTSLLAGAAGTRVYFQDRRDYVREFSWINGDQVLTPSWPNQIRAVGHSSLTCLYISDVGSRIYFLDTSHKIVELALDGGSSTYTKTGIRAVAGSPLTCLLAGSAGTRIYFLDENHFVREVVFSGGNSSLTPLWPKAVPAAPDSALTCLYISDSGSRVYFLNTAHHVIELALSGGSASYLDTGIPSKSGGPLACLLAGSSGTRVYFIEDLLPQPLQIREIVLSGGEPSLTPQWPHSIPVVAGSSLACLYISDVGSRVYYLDSNDHVIELTLDGGGSSYKDTGKVTIKASPMSCSYISNVGSRVYYLDGYSAVTELAL